MLRWLPWGARLQSPIPSHLWVKSVHNETLPRKGRIHHHGLAPPLKRAVERPASAHQDARLVEARHLLRALLRECTYLPDSFARRWMHRHILQRFRTYGFKAWEHRNDPAFDERLREKHKEARYAVQLLHRANEGERRPLMRVLLLAYGRSGKRRHELMLPLLYVAGRRELQTVLDDSTELEENVFESATTVSAPSKQSKPSAQDVNAGNWTPYAPELTPPLRALLASQIRYPPPHLTRPTLRRVTPKIDELNSWLRPMPRVRVKNQTKQWYADLLDRVHPPLPSSEWERLRDLATGVLTESVVSRRKSTIDAGSSALDLVVQYGKPDVRKAFGNRDAHKITPRFMRRMWAMVFAQCPRMEWDAVEDVWRVEWGLQALHRPDTGNTV